MLELTLTGQCPSGKNAITITRTGHRFPKPRFVEWRTEALRQISRQVIRQKFDKIIDSPVSVYINYYPSDRRRRDVPGIIDALWHVIEKAEIVTDDKLLGGTGHRTDFVQHEKSTNPRVEILISMDENRLIARVLLQAVVDLSSDDPTVREEAKDFFLGDPEALKNICEPLGLNERRIISMIKSNILPNAQAFKKIITSKLKEKCQSDT